jgi:hypothetical protein
MRDIKCVRQYGPVAAAGLICLILSLSHAAITRTAAPVLWRGYQTLVVREDLSLDEVVARLARGMATSDIVSSLTSTVSITVFGDQEDVSVASLDSRLDPRDPRRDDYTTKLAAMFRGETPEGPAHVLYLRSAAVGPFPGLRVGRLLRGLEGGWSMPDRSPLVGPLRLAAALAYLVLLSLGGSSAKTRLFLGLTALPWLLGCLLGDFADLLAFYMVYPFCSAFLARLRTFWPSRGRLGEILNRNTLSGATSFGLAMVAAALTTLILGGGVAEMARTPLSVLANAAALAAAVIWDRRPGRADAHRVFVPLAISRRLARMVPGRRLRPDVRPMLRGALDLLLTRGGQVAAVLAVVCVSPLVFLAGRGERAQGLPVPDGSGVVAPTWEGLRDLWVVSRGDDLPNLADYVAHVAYQRTLGWGGVYGLPARGETLAVPYYRYREEEPAVLGETRTVTVFGDPWLQAAIAAARPGSVEELLAGQGGAARVRLSRERPLDGPSVRPQNPALWRITVALAVVSAFLILGSRQLGPEHLAGIRSRVALPIRAPSGALTRRGQIEA